MNYISHNTGFVRTIILIVVALLIISYFGFSLRSIVESPTGSDNFSYVKEITLKVWNDYLKRPATYLWHIFIDLIWDPAIKALTSIRDGEPETLRLTNTPTVPTPQTIPN